MPWSHFFLSLLHLHSLRHLNQLPYYESVSQHTNTEVSASVLYLPLAILYRARAIFEPSPFLCLFLIFLQA